MNRRRLLQVAAVAGAGLAFPWAAPRAHAEADQSPGEVLAALKEGNARYASGEMNLVGYTSERESMASGQSPRAIVLGCSDSRVPPEIIFDQNRGEIFVVRVAGNFVAEEGLASIEYSVKVLGSRLIVVLGHSGCGAIDATITYVEEGAKLPGHLPLLVQAIKPAVEKARGEPGNLLTNTIAANAQYNAAKLAKATPIVSKAVDEGRVKVVAGVYDLKSGKVAFLS